MENPFEIIVDRLDKIETLLKQLVKTENIAPPVLAVNEILNTNQAADYLSITKSTLYKHTAEREIPHYKNGKKLYFKRVELEEWLTRHRITTKGEIEQMANEYILRSQKKGKKY